MKNGWIKVHRKLIESSVFDNPKLLKTWIWCLCKASHTEHEVIIGRKIVKLKQGQFIFGRLKAAETLNMNDRTVYDYMKLLKDMNMVNIYSNNKYSIVTIVNWGAYQDTTDENQQQSTIKSTTESTIESTIEKHTYKNDKEWLKNEKNVGGRFKPPTLGEVKQYCSERNNTVDSERFIDFYQSKNWFIGKNKMKDWKAAVRTWEKRSNKQPANQLSNMNDLDDIF